MIFGDEDAGRSRASARHGPSASLRAGGAALNILVFIVGTVLVLGGVIAGERRGVFDRLFGPGESAPAAAPDNAATPPDAIVEWNPDHAPASPDNVPAPEARVRPPVPPAAPRFVGDLRYKSYHRPDCKLVKTIPEDQRVAFGSAREAFDKDCIPCKVCMPEAPEAHVEPVAAPAARAVSNQLVGDSARHRYHRADCKYVAAITPENRVALKSSAEAFNRDYFPCRTCDPDVPVLMTNLPPPRPVPEAPETPGVRVEPVASGPLTESQKRAMYVSLCALKEMLKGIGRSDRPYEVLSDRYGVPTGTVRAVESEGSSKRWPTR